MSHVIFTLLQVLGLVPLFPDKIKQNLILPSCFIIISQTLFVYTLYVLIGRTLFEPTYKVLLITGIAFQNLVVSVCLCMTMTKPKKWKVMAHFMEHKIFGNLRNIMMIVFGLVLPIIVILIEYFLIKRSDLPRLFIWINYHFYRCLQHLYLYIVLHIISNIAQKYLEYNDSLRQNNAMDISVEHQMSIHRRKYLKLFKLVETCNVLFSWPLFLTISGLFINSLGGILYLHALTEVSRETILSFVLTYVLQQVTILVSFQHIIYSYY